VALFDLAAGAFLFRAGDAGVTLYVVVDGEVAVQVDGPLRVEVARLGSGAFFGEIALVTDQPRSATIVATVPTQLLAIDREVVRQLIVAYPEVLKVLLRFLRERLVDALIQTHPLFQPYGEAERRDLVSRFRFLEIELGATILATGSRTAGLYVLLAGRAEVRRDGVLVEKLGPGDLFGEISVLTGEASDVTIGAGTRCLALCLPTHDFREIIMTHSSVLSYMSDLVEQRRSQQPAPRARRVNWV
jgi:cAMP-dependent protein kinase regulator